MDLYPAPLGLKLANKATPGIQNNCPDPFQTSTTLDMSHVLQKTWFYKDSRDLKQEQWKGIRKRHLKSEFILLQTLLC